MNQCDSCDMNHELCVFYDYGWLKGVDFDLDFGWLFFSNCRKVTLNALVCKFMILD